MDDRWISVLYGLLLLVILWPALRRMPRGSVLRNIVIWLALFAAVGLGYRLFGPA